MYKNKKGIIILECVIYIALSFIISCILVKVLLGTDYIYMKSIKSHKVKSDISDLCINIDRFINEEDVTKIEVNNDELTIYKGSFAKNFQKEEILKEADKIIIKYYDIRNFQDYNTRNVLAKDVEEFKVKVKGKLIYVFIDKGGEKYIRCL